jgi:hypothetical protein
MMLALPALCAAASIHDCDSPITGPQDPHNGHGNDEWCSNSAPAYTPQPVYCRQTQTTAAGTLRDDVLNCGATNGINGHAGCTWTISVMCGGTRNSSTIQINSNDYGLPDCDTTVYTGTESHTVWHCHNPGPGPGTYIQCGCYSLNGVSSYHCEATPEG